MFKALLSVFCRKNSKMVNPPILEATFASGIILIATGFYGTQFLINHSGSDMAKLAIETNLECSSMIDSSDYYANCTYKLEQIMKNLTESGEIRLEDCELDGLDKSIAYCPVWVWYYPQWLPMTDVTIIGVVGTNTNTETIKPPPKLKKIFSRLSEASLQLTDLSDEGRLERLNKLEQIFSSQSEVPQQISVSSDQDKREHEDELDRIFSAMLLASENLIDDLDKEEIDLVDQENILHSTLEALTEHLNLNNVESLIENPEHLQTLLNTFNTNDFEDSDFEDPLSKLAPLISLLPVLLSSLGTNGADNTFDKFGEMSTILQGFETENVEGLLQKSGLVELLVQHVETNLVNEASDKSDIERALAQSLKGNPYFENTLKLGIADVISKNLETNDNQALFGKLGLQALLALNLQTDGLSSSLDKLGFIKDFLQNVDTEDFIKLLEKSGLVGTLPHLEANYIEAYHDKSDLGQALVDNIKTNHYIDDSARSDLMKRFVPNAGLDDTSIPQGEQNLIAAALSQKMDTKDIQSPLDSLVLLKSLVPSLKTNSVPGEKPTFNSEMDIMSSIFQNLNKGDVRNFVEKSGFIEAFVQPLEKQFQNNPNFEQSSTQNDKNIESSLEADYNKSFLPNLDYSTGESQGINTKDTENHFTNVNILKSLGPSLDSTTLENPINKLSLIKSVLQNVDVQDVADFLEKSGLVEKLTHAGANYPEALEKLDLGLAIANTIASNTQNDYNLSDKLGLMQTLIKSIYSNNVQSNSLNNGFSTTFPNQDEKYETMDTLGLSQTLGETLQQSDKETSSSGESGFNFQKYKEQNDWFSKGLGDTKLDPNLP